MTVSVISFAEVYEGIYRFDGPKKEELERNFLFFLKGLQVFPVTEELADTFAKQRAILRKTNKLIDNFDLLIGVTALYYDLELLTDNVKHFERIEGLTIRNLNDFS